MSRTIDGQGARTRLASKPIDAGPVRTGRPDDTGAAAAARRAGRDLPRFARSRGGFSAIASRVLTALPAALVVLVAVVGPSLIPLVTSGSATSPVGGSFAPPSPGLPLGTDMLGRDALARVLAGGQALIAQAVSATLLGSAVGLVTGVWAGSTHRRRTEAVVLRIIDAIAAIPALLLLLLLAAGSPGDDAVVAIAIAAVSVPFSVRVVRERTRMLASSDAALEAVARGDGRWMRVRDDLLPGLIRVALAEAGIRFVAAAQLAATAGFLGLGGGAPAAGWGRMVRENTAGLALNPLPVLVPALLLMLLAIGVTALLDRVVERGDARVLAPRMRVPGRDRGRAGVRPRGGGGDAAEPSAARVVDGASVSSLTVADTSGVLVLDGLDLDLPAGEVTGLVGESGAGKTTLALALLGHLGGGLRLAGGSVRVNGHDPFTTTGRRAVRGRAAAYLPQDPSSALDPSRTVVAQLRTAARIAHPRASPGRRAALVNRAVHDAAFEPDLLGRRPLHLSGGQAQRALLAWAYVARPRLLILDEPTSGLDPETAGRVSARFAALPWRPAVLLISHDRELVDRICTTTVIIGEGRASPAVRRGRLSPTVALIADEADAAGSGVARSAPDAGADPAAHPPTLAARGVTIRRGGRALLDDAAFEVGAGELVAVRGPSGSGKTSLARAVGGLAPPVAGELRLGDRALPWDARERARASAPFVAYLGQDAVAALNPGETVDRALRRALATAARRGRELDLSLGLGGDGDGDGDGDGGRDSTAARLLRLVGLDPGLLDRTPDRLSGGQRHRVVLARAVAAAPAALVCDETTAALDHAAGERMLDTIDRLRRDAGMPVLFVTHQSAVTDRADRVLTLEKGHLR